MHSDHKCPNRRANNATNKSDSLKSTIWTGDERISRQIADNKEARETFNEV